MDTPGTIMACVQGLPVLMTLSSTSRESTCTRAACCTSTTGAAPETVTVSSRAPTDNWMSSSAVNSDGRSKFSCTTVPKPARENIRL